MRHPLTRRGRLGSVVGVLALAAGSALAAAGPADATSLSSARSLSASPAAASICDPAGSIQLNPTDSVVTGSVENVTWNAINLAACNPPITSVRMSGPGFNGDEIVSASGSRAVTITQPAPSKATWTLSVTTRFGETALDVQSVLVVTPPPPNTGVVSGSVAFSGLVRNETRATVSDTFVASGALVMADTSPSLVSVGSDYEAAYHGVDGHLWLVAPDGTGTDTGQAMAAGTSPSIAATGSRAFTVAFQASNSVLTTYSSVDGAHSLGLPMDPGTSPSATLDSAGVAIAYVDPNGHLSVFDPVFGYGGYGLAVAPGSSPAITYMLGSPNSYRIVYQGADHGVRTADSSGAQSDTLLTSAATSSPAITTLPTGEIDIALNASDGTVKVVSMAGSGSGTNTGARFEPGTSPTIAPSTGGGVVAAWADPIGKVAFFVSGGGVSVTGLGTDPGTSPAWAQITSTTR